jgi:hypothetical protein
LTGPGRSVPSGWWTGRGRRIRIRTGLPKLFASGCRAHPRWGPKKIRAWLEEREPAIVWPAVGLRAVAADCWDIWYGPIRLARIDHRGCLTRHHPTPLASPKPGDLMDNAAAFPTTPQAQQPQ